jgi:hypothetical protein
MELQLTKDNVHETLLRGVIHELDNTADALAWITLFIRIKSVSMRQY